MAKSMSTLTTIYLYLSKLVLYSSGRNRSQMAIYLGIVVVRQKLLTNGNLPWYCSSQAGNLPWYCSSQAEAAHKW
jgi:hypothetical protein